MITRQYMRLPVAKIGNWFIDNQPVQFTQATLDTLADNVRRRVAGYEAIAHVLDADGNVADDIELGPDGKPLQAYAKVGHNRQGLGIYAGERAEGFIVGTVQEDDVLFGIFEPVDDAAIADLKNYRYASAEIKLAGKNRETNELVGPYLKGVGLTNSPRITGLPRNTVVESDTLSLALSDDGATIAFSHELDHGADMPNSNDNQAPAAATDVGAIAATFAKFQAFMENVMTAKPATEAPAATTVVPATTPSIDPAVAAMAAELETLRAEKAALETSKTEAEVAAEALAVAAAAEKLASETAVAEAEAAVAAAKLATAEAEAKRIADINAITAARKADELAAKELSVRNAAEAKEQALSLALAEKSNALITAGLAPIVAERAVAFARHIAETAALKLSDEDETETSSVDALFLLLAEASGAVVEMRQVGTVDAPKTAGGARATVIPTTDELMANDEFLRERVTYYRGLKAAQDKKFGLRAA